MSAVSSSSSKRGADEELPYKAKVSRVDKKVSSDAENEAARALVSLIKPEEVPLLKARDSDYPLVRLLSRVMILSVNPPLEGNPLEPLNVEAAVARERGNLEYPTRIQRIFATAINELNNLDFNEEQLKTMQRFAVGYYISSKKNGIPEKLNQMRVVGYENIAFRDLYFLFCSHVLVRHGQGFSLDIFNEPGFTLDSPQRTTLINRAPLNKENFWMSVRNSSRKIFWQNYLKTGREVVLKPDTKEMIFNKSIPTLFQKILNRS